MRSCGGPGRSVSARHGRASKGGSPCSRHFASRRHPGSPGCWSSSDWSSHSPLPRCGSGRANALPQPFGPARNGAIVSSHDGDIYAVDPVTHAERLLVGGKTMDFGPSFSRDGTKLLFLRGSGDPGDDKGLILAVANADGTAVRELTPQQQGFDWLDWSPDSEQIAFLSQPVADGPRLINVANVDGSGITTLDVGRSAHFLSWLPPLGREIVFRGEQLTPADPPPGLFAVHPDGSGLRQLSRTPASNDIGLHDPGGRPGRQRG